MDNITSKDYLKPILTNLKRMYFNDYWLILLFSITFTQNDIFLKLMYRAFSQKRFQNKLLTLPLQCDLERDLQPILYNIYKKNIELECIDYKITRQEFLRARVDFLGDQNIFDLPTIAEEERWLCYQPPLSGHAQQRFHSYLVNPKYQQK